MFEKLDVTKNPAVYIPAGSALQIDVLLGKNFDKAKQLMWYMKDSLFHHPYILTSAYYGNMKPWKDKSYREWFHINKGECEHWGDSGGFQAFTQGQKLDPKEIIKWLEDNCEYGFALDDPGEYSMLETVNGEEKDRISSSEFNKSAQNTLKNNEAYGKFRTSKELKIYNVLHGNSLDQIETWYKYVSQVPFDGWALGMKPVSDPTMFTFAAMYLWDKGVRENIHFFGVSGQRVVPIIVYMTRYFKHITYDSSSYAVGAMYRRFFNPLDISYKITIGEKTKDTMYKMMPCDCPYCRNVTKVDRLYEAGAFSGTVISMHNLYQMVRCNKILNMLNQVDKDFKDFVSDYPKIPELMQFVDMSVNEGFEKAYRKYACLFHKLGVFQDENSRWSFLEGNLGLNLGEDKQEKSKSKRKEKIEEVAKHEYKEEKHEKTVLPMQLCGEWL